MTTTHRELLQVGVSTRRAATLTGLAKSTQDRLTRRGPSAPQTEPAAAGRRPVNRLTDAEEEHVLTVLNGERFADKPPAQIYATLLAEGVYLCSISTMYRILTNHDHRHAGIGLHTPADVHYGLATATAQRRSQALAAARTLHPTRFATDHDPKILDLPPAAWINEPNKTEDDTAA